MSRRRVPDRTLLRVVERLERQHAAARAARKRKLPKRPEIDWAVAEETGRLIGKGVGKRLVQRYIKVLEDAWGGPPSTPGDVAVACQWIEESALKEALESPAWDSLQLTIQFYSITSPEGQAFDMRVWRAYEHALAMTVHERLLRYGCQNLRFLDMPEFVRYYRGEER